MKKILLLLCLLLCACSAQTDIKDYTVIYKNKEVYPGVSSSKMSDALFDSNIQYSEKDGKIQTITLFTKKYKLKNSITVGTDYSTVKHTYSSPTSNHYNNGKGTITYKYKEKNIQIKFTFKNKKFQYFLYQNVKITIDVFVSPMIYSIPLAGWRNG